MRKKIIILALIWAIVAVVVLTLYIIREIPLVKGIIGWLISIWQIPAAIGSLAILVSGWIVKHDFSYHRKADSLRDDATILLQLLDDVYKRLKGITRLTIRKLRQNDWKDMESATIDLMWLTDVDVESAIIVILEKNMMKFMTGQPMTITQDTKRLSSKIKTSPLFTRNPEDIARDASVILREKVPYLKKKMEHDRIYNKLLKRIERERDKLPSESISNTIDAYLDHSIKVNAAWVMSERELDGMDDIEYIVGHPLPMTFKVILMGLPGRMDEEMTGYRNKVAIAILEYLKGNS